MVAALAGGLEVVVVMAAGAARVPEEAGAELQPAGADPGQAAQELP